MDTASKQRSAVVQEATAEVQPKMQSGPNPRQVTGWARLLRRACRHREYTRWTDQYCQPLHIIGRERLDGLHGPAIFIANHQSHMDTPVIMAALPDRLKDNFFFGAAADRWFVKGKRKLILQPWYQSLVMGNFPIVRGGGSKTLDYARWLLVNGHNICIFPEGTRSTSSELGEFRHGVSLLARALGVPVVPVVLKGLRELRPKGAREITPGPVVASILDPVYLTAGMSVEESTTLLRNTMSKAFSQTLVFNEPQASRASSATGWRARIKASLSDRLLSTSR
ncbi:MAG: 1-acyl-sn-glycerol-3-phosphate acyltransferase [Candidatus Pseudothioglobus sp.]